MADDSRSWGTRYILLLVAMAAVGVIAARHFDRYAFDPVSVESVTALLVPLLVISLFMERALEVFVSAWRDIGRAPLEARRKELETALSESQAGSRDVRRDAEDAASALGRYRAETRRIAFLAALSTGIAVSAVGVRALRPLTSLDAEIVGTQGFLFNLLDVFLTGALLGGGSEGIHKVISVITDFLDATRSSIQAGPSAAT